MPRPTPRGALGRPSIHPPRHKWARVDAYVYDGPLFGWTHTGTWWICECTWCIDQVANGRPSAPRRHDDPSLERDGRHGGAIGRADRHFATVIGAGK